MKSMGNSAYSITILALIILISYTISARHMDDPISQEYHGHDQHERREGMVATQNAFQERGLIKNHRKPHTVEIAGSRLPDCSHACGSCAPCRLVMVSLTCGSLQEAETCPMAYKCICNHKSYPVP